MGQQNHSTVRIFSSVRANPRKAPIRFVTSARPSFRPQVIPNGRIFVKFYTGNFNENVAGNSKFFKIAQKYRALYMNTSIFHMVTTRDMHGAIIHRTHCCAATARRSTFHT